jgi:hypothetical protein
MNSPGDDSIPPSRESENGPAGTQVLPIENIKRGDADTPSRSIEDADSQNPPSRLMKMFSPQQQQIIEKIDTSTSIDSDFPPPLAVNTPNHPVLLSEEEMIVLEESLLYQRLPATSWIDRYSIPEASDPRRVILDENLFPLCLLLLQMDLLSKLGNLASLTETSLRR